MYSCFVRYYKLLPFLNPEAPVRIVSPSESEAEVCILSSERLVLSCEISNANAKVCWFCDGMEVNENDNLKLEDEGIYHRLVVPCATIDDSAEYVCETTDDSVTFWVKIEGNFVSYLTFEIVHNILF